MADTIFDLQARVSADVSPFNKAMDTSADSVTSSLKTIHQAANTFIGSGVVKAFVKATEAAYGFSQAMADISAISDVNIKHLSNSIAKLDNVYGKMSHVGDTIYEMISSGIRGTEADYVHAVKSIGQASVSIKADLYDTANTVTTLLNAYNMSVKDIDKISDMLFVTVREGKAHGNELAKTLGLVTNTAAEAGVSFAELSAAISILSRTQTASQSMIGLNQLLNGLIKPTVEAKAEAEKWGIEIGATALKTKGLTTILTEMHDKIGGNVEAINRILGNIRAMRAGVALTGKQFYNFIEVLRMAESEIGTGVAFKAFEKQTATAQQSLKNLKTQIDKTFITFGQDFEPGTQKVVEAAESYLKSLTDSDNIVRRGLLYASAISIAYKGAASAIRMVKSVLRAASEGSKSMSESAKGFTSSVADLNSKHLPETEASFKRIQATIAQTANTLNMIKTRMNFVSGLAPAAAIDKALKGTGRQAMRAQAEENLGIKLHSKKYALRNKPLADLMDEAFTKSIRMSGWTEADFYNSDTRSLAMRNLGFTEKDLQAPKLMSADERHRRAMEAAYPKAAPKFVEANRFSKNLDVASEALKVFRQSVSAVSTKLNAAVLPDANRAALRKTYMSDEQIDAIVERNVRATYAPVYHKNKKTGEREVQENVLRDVETGEIVSAQVVKAGERRRVIGNLARQNTQIRMDARAQDAENIAARQRYDKAMLDMQNTDLRNTEQYLANKKALEDEVVQLNKDRSDALKNALASSEKAEMDYHKAVAQEAEERSEVAKDMLRQRAEQKKEADRVVAEQKAARKQKTLDRYNRRYGTTYKSLDDIKRHDMQPLIRREQRKRITAGAKRVGAGFVKVADGLNAFTMMVTSAVEGFAMGKALGEKFKVADWALTKWIDKLLHFDFTDYDKVAKDVEKHNIRMLRRSFSKDIDLAVSRNDITKTEAELLKTTMALVKSEEELRALIEEAKKKFKPEDKKPEDKTPTKEQTTAEALKKHNETIGKLKEGKVAATAVEVDYMRRVLESKGLSETLVNAVVGKLASENWKDFDPNKLDIATLYGRGEYTPVEVSKQLSMIHPDDSMAAVSFDTAEMNKQRERQAEATRTKVSEAWTAIQGSRQRNINARIKRLTEDADKAQYLDNVEGAVSRADAKKTSYTTESNAVKRDLWKTYKSGNLEDIESTIAFADIEGAMAAYGKTREAIDDLKADLLEFDNSFAHVDKAYRERQKNAVAKGKLDTLARDLLVKEQQIAEFAEKYYASVLDGIDKKASKMLEKGVSEDSERYAQNTSAVIDAELAKLNKKLKETTDEKIAAYYRSMITRLEAKKNENAQDILDRRSRDRQSLVSAGMRGQSYAIRGDIKDLEQYAAKTKKDIEDFEKKRKGAKTADSKKYYENKIADANKRLYDTNVKLNGKFKELSESTLQLRSNLLSTASEFASQRNARGKMSNQGLWHSVNLMARASGAGMKGSMPYTVSAGATYNRASMAKSREKAQSQISASIDSWIMSQKYAEANTGRAVLDIRNKLMQDNYIMVRK
jgi:TP901 family phage tail tape measure protein